MELNKAIDRAVSIVKRIHPESTFYETAYFMREILEAMRPVEVNKTITPHQYQSPPNVQECEHKYTRNVLNNDSYCYRCGKAKTEVKADPIMEVYRRWNETMKLLGNKNLLIVTQDMWQAIEQYAKSKQGKEGV